MNKLPKSGATGKGRKHQLSADESMASLETAGTISAAFPVTDGGGRLGARAAPVILGILIALLPGCQPPGGGREPDTQPPVIVLLGNPTVTVTVGSPYVDPGATAQDNADGDITSRIVVLNPVNTSRPGIYLITYNVADSAGNAATQVSREVRVIDPAAPMITLLGSARIVVAVGAVYVDPGATASDDVDGDTTSRIVTVDPVNTSQPGTYLVTYNVTDSSGNPALEVTRQVIVDGLCPVITLSGDASMMLAAGSVFFDPGASAMDDVDGDISGRIVRVNPVNSSVPGTYSVTYNVVDTAGNRAVEVRREVIIRDLTPPVITLIGPARVVISRNSSYVDAGATARDNVDGDITGRISTVNTVDTSSLGTYKITYNVTDAAGNTAVEVFREVTVVVFSLTFGGSKFDAGSSVIEASDGTYVVTGFTGASNIFLPFDTFSSTADLVLTKIDAAGSQLWSRTFGGPDGDRGNSVIEAANGDYVVCGQTDDNVWVIRTDSSGNTIWNRTFAGPYYQVDSGYSIIETSDGTLVLTAVTQRTHPLTGQGDVWVIKLDAGGNLLWNAVFGGSYYDSGQSIVETSDGDYVLAGYTQAESVGSTSAWVIKVDKDGNKIWDKVLSGTYVAYSIVQASDGTLVLTGSASNGSGGTDVLVTRLDSNGNELWRRTYDKCKYDCGYSIMETTDRGFVLTGYCNSSSSGSNYSGSDVWVIRLDGNGSIVWDRTFGGPGVDVGYSVIQASDGSYVLTGMTTPEGSGSSNVWVIRF